MGQVLALQALREAHTERGFAGGASNLTIDCDPTRLPFSLLVCETTHGE